MSSVKIGDTFTIEINRVYKDDTGRTLYGVKGFNSLVFDDIGIGKLEPPKAMYTEDAVREISKAAFNDGQNETWELVKTIEDKMTDEEFSEAFDGTGFFDIFRKYTPQQASKMAAEYMKKKENHRKNVHVGDIMQKKETGDRYIVTGFDDNEDRLACILLGFDGNVEIDNVDCVFKLFDRVSNNQEMVSSFLDRIKNSK